MLFQWSRLEAGTIRLVRFLPYSTPSNLYLALEHRFGYWEEAVQYKALSYVHGDHTNRKSVTLAGRSFMITANLYAALAAVYARGEGDCWLWVDQLCMNHQNIAEKNSQVAQMGSIYASADKVLAWLRPQDSMLRELATGEAEQNTGRSKCPGHDTAAVLRDIARHPYWHRAWTRVEALRAQSLEIMYGDCFIKHEQLQSLHGSMQVADQEVLRAALQRFLPKPEPGPADDNVHPATILSEVMLEYSKCISSNVLDRIFALLNDPRLDTLPLKHRPQPNYGLTAPGLASALALWHDDLRNVPATSPTSGMNPTLYDFHGCLTAVLDLP
ncbi:hypothetical protein CLAFUW4_14203 [Fulvia fulva]|uniref:Heterokaryon incompatibility domain-containing protein n=1 Tax=Passalora fulva TaxID=5499 RepID=A0A9Q8UW79_PASFU|nr:uncharacterized protein CLAFUR5_14036 [Fulvia fulva]KAK4610109.1 hypothetical protein CLAFUR4_14206 [Fulvia fulva]KAK4610838.1 hypothetical protein CLAFUR0_14211 [Fulvia fulva]UJO24731.1 hypothetical protein CLAFUR5_14036 [Fulvia fulva]WPV21728.1 hypothetical protein CLAFUW4_14203 [Fulvia fulva]WPV37124.1 hypothetical protein CLAFUW7_14214 [Fulvia fulva]